MKFILFANTDWYLFNFRRSLAVTLKEGGHEVLLVSPDGPYGPKLRAMGFSWQPVPMDRGSLNPFRELVLLRHLFRLFKRERPDLVHGFTIKCAVYGALAARLAGVTGRVSSVAGMGYVFTGDALKARLLRPLVRLLLRAALDGRNARLILQNPDDVAFFVKAGLVNTDRIRLIRGSGVDCTRFHPGPSLDPSGMIRVLLPARMLWDKGVAEFVNAARQLRSEGLDAEFLLAGEPDPGNPAAIPEATIRGWVQEGVVTWLGHVEDMPNLFRSVQIVALPSYREGLPKGLIEAGASGCALIATDVPGCREVITHDVDGLLVPAKDAETLADGLRRLVSDSRLRGRLSDEARSKANLQFSDVIINTATLAIYQEVGW